MSYVVGAIILGTLLFLLANLDWNEEDVIEFIKASRTREVDSLVISDKFGGGVYPVLRRLASKGILIEREKPTRPGRNEHPVLTYEVKQVPEQGIR